MVKSLIKILEFEFLKRYSANFQKFYEKYQECQTEKDFFNLTKQFKDTPKFKYYIELIRTVNFVDSPKVNKEQNILIKTN